MSVVRDGWEFGGRLEKKSRNGLQLRSPLRRLAAQIARVCLSARPGNPYLSAIVLVGVPVPASALLPKELNVPAFATLAALPVKVAPFRNSVAPATMLIEGPTWKSIVVRATRAVAPDTV